MEEDPDSLSVTEVHMNVYCGLPDDLAKRVGIDHNSTKFCKKMTYMESLVSIRASLYHRAGHVRSSDIDNEEPTAVKKILEDWKNDLVIILGCESRSQLHDRHGRSIKLASMPCDVWQAIVAFARKWERGEVVGQTKSTVVKRHHFDFLKESLADEMAPTLRRLAEGEVNYKDVKKANQDQEKMEKEEKKKKKKKTPEKALGEGSDDGRSEEALGEGSDDGRSEEALGEGSEDGRPEEALGEGSEDNRTKDLEAANRQLMSEIEKLREENRKSVVERSAKEAELEIKRAKNRELEEEIKKLQKQKRAAEDELERVRKELKEEQVECQVLRGKLDTEEDVSTGLLFSLENEKEKEGGGTEEEQKRKSNKRKSTDKGKTSDPARKKTKQNAEEPRYAIGTFVVVCGSANEGEDKEPWFGKVIGDDPVKQRLRLSWFVQSGGKFVPETLNNKAVPPQNFNYNDIITTVEMAPDMSLPSTEMDKAWNAISAQD
ncbi:Hypp8348 [Branchiostoma lanceolatum]|uniref:Hypp8348 protein n=1 Tax=Branchiostoma lanceolatum TaxID=7740 RepID=A0A8K0EDA2_BRALA|nr:Hypp8348 [Branchiostoma lanceolatum]